MGCGGCRRQVSIQITSAKKLRAPVMHPDGSIEFPEGQSVPLIDGYTVDDENHLIPDENCACDWKITGIMLQKGGSYKPHHVCRQSKCEHRSQPVIMDICRECPLRELS